MAEDERTRFTRRQALAVSAAGLGVAGLGCTPPPTPRARPEEGTMSTAATRQPALYIPHGGGPWPFVDGLGLPGTWDRLRTYLEQLGETLPTPPKALLVISAHWEEAVPTVMTAARPPMLYDYYGFPAAAYEVQWPAPGAPVLAARVEALLKEAGLPTASDSARGFDHGTFDPALHVALGRALAPLRDEGVLIVGSGMSFHNMRAFRSGSGFVDQARAFDTWLQHAVTQGAAERNAALTAWSEAPGARTSHPREEHLLPLMVIAGAAGDDRGRVPYTDTLMGHTVSAVHFG